jgi:hypothetical protein
MLAGQTADTKARIMSQLDAQPGGRPFGGGCVLVDDHSGPHI